MKRLKKWLLIIFLTSSLSLVLSSYTTGLYKVVFCDVGQGSATLLQMGAYQILIDTGPDQRVLGCVGRHIPFFDYIIDMVVISHNQKDHNGGLLALYNKYTIKQVIGPQPKPSFLDEMEFIEVKDTISLRISDATIVIHKASQSSNDINESANVVTIFTPIHTIFLPSDINGLELKRLIPEQTTILAIPHHGSKYGLYPDSLGLAIPRLGLISVGKKNSYGHPAKEVLDILKAKNIKVWRTDQQGELAIDLK